MANVLNSTCRTISVCKLLQIDRFSLRASQHQRTKLELSPQNQKKSFVKTNFCYVSCIRIINFKTNKFRQRLICSQEQPAQLPKDSTSNSVLNFKIDPRVLQLKKICAFLVNQLQLNQTFVVVYTTNVDNRLSRSCLRRFCLVRFDQI